MSGIPLSSGEDRLAKLYTSYVAAVNAPSGSGISSRRDTVGDYMYGLRGGDLEVYSGDGIIPYSGNGLAPYSGGDIRVFSGVGHGTPTQLHGFQTSPTHVTPITSAPTRTVTIAQPAAPVQGNLARVTASTAQVARS